MKQKLFIIVLSMLSFGFVNGQAYNGTYSLKTDEATLTLTLEEVSGGMITGSLTSTKGVNFQVQGQLQEGVVMGVCSDEQSGVYFEAYLEGMSLSLGLIEPDQFNMPDYNTAQYYVFEKQVGSQKPAPAIPHTAPVNPNQGMSQTQPTANLPSGPSGKTGNSNFASNEAGDVSWGWKFTLPADWQSQKSTEGIYLGHNTIAGLIMVLPHNSENMQQLQQEMMKGISEEGNYLQLNGSLESLGNGILGGEYTGMMNGTQVQARGLGTLSPYGGGAFVIAVTTPEKYGSELKNTAGSIAQNMSYFKTSSDDLMRHFAGKWTSFTKNTSTWVSLFPDGRYGEQYESSYSGDLSQGGNWMTAGQNDRGGRWTIRGNKEQGQIIVKLNNGNEIIYNYRVHVERGETYWSEYYFNGSLYSKSRIE